jgi:hypothetical protein
VPRFSEERVADAVEGLRVRTSSRLTTMLKHEPSPANRVVITRLFLVFAEDLVNALRDRRDEAAVEMLAEQDETGQYLWRQADVCRAMGITRAAMAQKGDLLDRANRPRRVRTDSAERVA